jgi:hypothetical protein
MTALRLYVNKAEFTQRYRRETPYAYKNGESTVRWAALNKTLCNEYKIRKEWNMLFKIIRSLMRFSKAKKELDAFLDDGEPKRGKRTDNKKENAQTAKGHSAKRTGD